MELAPESLQANPIQDIDPGLIPPAKMPQIPKSVSTPDFVIATDDPQPALTDEPSTTVIKGPKIGSTVLHGAKAVLEVATEAADALPQLKSVLGGIRAIVKLCEVGKCLSVYEDVYTATEILRKQGDASGSHRSFEIFQDAGRRVQSDRKCSKNAASNVRSLMAYYSDIHPPLVNSARYTPSFKRCNPKIA